PLADPRALLHRCEAHADASDGPDGRGHRVPRPGCGAAEEEAPGDHRLGAGQRLSDEGRARDGRAVAFRTPTTGLPGCPAAGSPVATQPISLKPRTFARKSRIPSPSGDPRWPNSRTSSR